MKFVSPHRILIGPLYDVALLGRWLGDPNIRTFNASRPVTLSERHPLRPLLADSHYDYETASFSEILAQLPPGWEPDLVIWTNLSLYGLPPGVEDCPYPTLAIVHDWHLNLPVLLDYVAAFDYVVCDKGLLEILARQGFERCAWWSCYGHDPQQHYLLPGLDRPYDIVFAGNISYHFHAQRNRWLERLCRLEDRYRVLISDRRYGYDYLRLLNQSKIVFNYSIRGEMNMRAYEAAACGALVMCEADNLEIRDFLSDSESCVLYNEDNLEAKIAYYLADDAERQRIAGNGVSAIAGHDAEQQFARLLAMLPTVQAAFAAGGRQRFRKLPIVWKRLLQEQQFAQSRTRKTQPPALAQLVIGSSNAREQAQLQAIAGAIGLRRHWDALRLLHPGPLPAEIQTALQLLEASVTALPEQLWSAYNLACGLSLAQPQRALPLWAQLLPRLQNLQPADVDFKALSWLPGLEDSPENSSGNGSPGYAFVFETTTGTALPAMLGAVLAGRSEPHDLGRLLQHQAFELIGYCLMRLGQPAEAIQAFAQAETLMPGSYFTYAPLLQSLQQTGRQSEGVAWLSRACEQMGLTEFLLRDLIGGLLEQGQLATLKAALLSYRRLLTRVEGGGPKALETPQAWIPGLMLWLPELLEQKLNEAVKPV